MLRPFRLLAGAALALSAASALAAATLEDRIVVEARNRSQAMRILSHLCDRIGPRLTGSENLDKAVRWAMGRFRAWGLKNVRYEVYGTMPGFDREPGAYARMVAPVRRDLQFTAMAWTVGTEGAVRGRAVVAPATLDELRAVRDRLPGAWVVYREKAGGRGSQPAAQPDPEVEALLDQAGIAGRVRGSASERLMTHGRPGRPDPAKPAKPSFLVRASDLDAILDFLALGTPVELEFRSVHRFSAEDRPIGNVIAEIPGREKPDEVVILSAHLDSWDGPGSQGCQDNGTGTTIVMEAARVLASLEVQPRRTIRFILWTGEEQGLLGSSAYVRANEPNLSKISAVFVEDNGGGFDAGLACTEGQAAFFRPVFERIAREFPGMAPAERIVERMPTRSGGSDHAPFVARGVPAFFWRKGGGLSYGLIWHTQYDRLDQVNPAFLVQSCATNALTVWTLAETPELLPRE
ncbi:MAG: M20/M25/M40 family metallo-hydrolase [Fimbriimonadales bacterium]|nr:M20/M25/M40 family metallo-hydrolase [Fimbriimonadales bacterium]